MTTKIARRQFISAFGGAAVAWSQAARAQQSERMRRIGVLIGYASSADDPVARQAIRAFREAMQGAGWIEDKNISVDYRFTAGSLAKTNSTAAELVALAPDLIYAFGLPATQALHQKTRTIPIVFTQCADPVGFGLVTSLAHPGGNLTGFMAWELSIGGKWLELLREIAPELSHVGIIYNPDTASYAPPLIASAKAAAGREVTVIEFPVHDGREIEAALSSLGHEPHGGLLVIPEPFTNSHQEQIITLTAQFGIPTITSFGRAADRGALISYTYAFDAMIQGPVAYIDRILKGASPSDLPVQAPTKFELSINLKTAKALGLTVPQSLLVAADEVVE
jgi:putative tryptophan/tyrosine transport system substrate-binding protein